MSQGPCNKTNDNIYYAQTMSLTIRQNLMLFIIQ
jgi:hypothetical protein